MSVSDPGEKIEWGADSEPRKNERVPSSADHAINLNILAEASNAKKAVISIFFN
jgi:hypothetical protein